MEPAAGRRAQEVRRDALDRPQSFMAKGIDAWNRFQKRPRIRMLRPVEDLIDRSLFDDLPGVHDEDPCAQAGDHAHVVCDHDDRGPKLLIQVPQQLQDLRLHGNVECGRRLVGDQNRWGVGQSHRDHCALAHASAQLMRKILDTTLGSGDAHTFEQLDGALTCLRFARHLVGEHRLGDLETRLQHRVSELCGSWKIIAMSRPRSSRISSSVTCSRS